MTGKKDSHYLTGKLLLAMPQMGDPRFHKAVILICVHDENGAMGLVVNRVQPAVKFSQLLEQLSIPSDIKLPSEVPDIPVMCGGPVETARGFLLHSNDFKQDDTISIDEAFSVTGTVDALKQVVGGKGPDSMLFILGYAGWSAEQLEQEIQQNAWLVVDPDNEIIFGDNPEIKWVKAVQKLGVDPAMLSGEAGRA